MLLSMARIAPLTGSADLDCDLIRDLLWHHRGTDPIEHVRIRAGPGHLTIAVFTRTASQVESDQVTRQLINRLLASVPQLRLWRLL